MAYELVQPPLTAKFREMSRAELLAYFNWFIQQMPLRRLTLEAAVNDTAGYEAWRADLSEESLDMLGVWFARQVETRQRTPEELARIEESLAFPIEVSDRELTSRTFSLAMDIGMYLFEMMRKQFPALSWGQHLRKTKRTLHVDHGQPVLAGFGVLSFNAVRLMTTLSYGIASGEQAGERLPEMYKIWASMVTAGA
jgi:hypothetical protein